MHATNLRTRTHHAFVTVLAVLVGYTPTLTETFSGKLLG